MLFSFFILLGNIREKRQAQQDAQTHPVNIHDIPLFVSLLVLAEKGQLHTYILTPYMLYFNFGLTRYERSDGSLYNYTASTVNGTLIDYAKSGYQVMSPPIYRQCVRQLEEALKQLPNVVQVDRHFGTELFEADARFIDENGQYANGQKIIFDSYSVTYKVTPPSAGKSRT